MSDVLIKPRAATVTLKLDASYRDRLKVLAQARKRTAHYLMKEAIERYLRAEEVQLGILRIVDESIAHFEATGMHITHAEVKAWAKEIKTNPNAKLPTCHL